MKKIVFNDFQRAAWTEPWLFISFSQTVLYCIVFRDINLPEMRPKSLRKFFPSSPLNIVKKPDIFTNKKPEPKKDDLLRMATLSKDTRIKSSKLLPVITRQKKSKPITVSGNSQSHSSESTTANQHSELSTSHRAIDSAAANQRSRKSDGVKQDRKEGVDGSSRSYTEKVSFYVFSTNKHRSS